MVDEEKPKTLENTLGTSFGVLLGYLLIHEKNYRSGKLRRRESWLDMSTKPSVFVSVTEEKLGKAN